MRGRTSDKGEISSLSIDLLFSLIGKGVINVIPLEVIIKFFPVNKGVVSLNSLVLEISSIFPLIGKAMASLDLLVLKISSTFLLKNINNNIFKP